MTEDRGVFMRPNDPAPEWRNHPRYNYGVGDRVRHFRGVLTATVVSFHDDGWHVFVHVDGAKKTESGVAYARWAWEKEPND